MPFRILPAAGGLVKVAIYALSIVTGCVLGIWVPAGWLDPNHWDLAGKIIGALVGLCALVGSMWKGLSHLHRRAVVQGRKEAIDDLLSIRTATDALVAQFGAHTADDSKQFEQLFNGQHQTHQMLEKLDEKMDGIRDQGLLTARDVDWLIRERGGDSHQRGSDRDRRR